MSGTTWIALVRGINVGPTTKLAMADLRSLLEGLGYDDVRTHLQSGNAIFTTTGKAADLEKQIARRIKSDAALDVPVVVRSGKQLDAVVEGNPFVDRGVDKKQLHVVFLSGKPPAKKLAAVDRDEIAPDEFEPGTKELYVRLPNGFRAARLPNWEKVLGLTATQRNWNTVTRLRELAAG